MKGSDLASVKVSLSANVVKHYLSVDTYAVILARVGGLAVIIAALFALALNTVLYMDARSVNFLTNAYQANIQEGLINQTRAHARPLDNQDLRLEWLSNIGLPKVTMTEKFKIFTAAGRLCCLCKSRSERLLTRLANKSKSRVDKSLEISNLTR